VIIIYPPEEGREEASKEVNTTFLRQIYDNITINYVIMAGDLKEP